MPISNFPKGFAAGVNIRGLPLLNTYGGNVFWVDSGAGSNGYKGTFDRPFATIDYAIGRCTANNGDIIMVKPGHTETVSEAGGIDCDVAGITIIGLGNVNDRPVISFSTSTGADIDIDAANIRIVNIKFDLTGKDALVAAIDVNAAGFIIEDCYILMADSGGQAVIAIDLSADADNSKILNNEFSSPDAGAAEAINFSGACDQVEIADNWIKGDFSNAGLYSAVAHTNCNIHHNIIENTQTGDHAIEFTTTATGDIYKNVLITDTITAIVDAGNCNVHENITAGAPVTALEVPMVGDIVYVHSTTGASTNDGRSPLAPLDKIETAFNKTGLAAGDTIVIMPGHTEEVSAAAGIDMDVAGVTVMGLGNKDNRPTITFSTSTLADIDIDAANIRIKNLKFTLSVDSPAALIDVNASGFIIEECEFLGTSSYQPDIWITLDANADGSKILNNEFIDATAGATEAIEIAGALTGLEIAYNRIWGDYSNACIYSSVAPTELDIHHNRLTNLQANDHCIELTSTATGVIAYNVVNNASLGAAATRGAIDPGSCFCIENYGSDGVGDVSGVLNPAADS